MLPLLFASLFLPNAHAEARLVGPSAELEAGVAASFTFVPDGKGALVDGCAAVELERKEGESWVAVTDMAGCDGSAVARAVDGSLSISLATPGAGEYRAVVTWGTGCVSGRPFGLSACKAVRTARSEAFTVRPAPPEGGQR